MTLAIEVYFPSENGTITVVCFVFSRFLKVKMSLDSLLDSLVSLSDIGDCVARVEHLLKELKSLEEKAQVRSTPHI